MVSPTTSTGGISGFPWGLQSTGDEISVPWGVLVIKPGVTLEKLLGCCGELLSLPHKQRSSQSDPQAGELTGLRRADNTTTHTFTPLQLSGTAPNVVLGLSSKPLGRAPAAISARPRSAPLSGPPRSHTTFQAQKTFLRMFSPILMSLARLLFPSPAQNSF